jgi:DNA-binding transcriptional ArsR family regulator/catechol 2,3-dioxygenase-like lactoylglutathione lyase family enzyme
MDALDPQVLAALSDPTRMELMRRLRDGPQHVKALSRGLPMTRSAVSQHLAVLRRADLVSAEKQGREVFYRLEPRGLEAFEAWVRRYRDFQRGRASRRRPARPTFMLNAVTVPVADQDRSARFYREALGFTVVNDRTLPNGFRWLTVAPPDGTALLHLHLVGADGHGFGERLGSWSGLVFMTDDMQTLYPRLLAAGVRFASAPTVMAWSGIEATFEDPDGNQFELVQLPAPSLDQR